MQCHKCPHHADVQAGKYARVPFKKTPCGSCTLDESSQYTKEFDEKRGVAVNEAETKDDGGWLPVVVMLEFVKAIMALPQELRDVVCWRYLGHKYRDIAAAQKTTMACAEARHRRAMELAPVLKALFPVKEAKQRVRKPHSRESHDDCRP